MRRSTPAKRWLFWLVVCLGAQTGTAAEVGQDTEDADRSADNDDMEVVVVTAPLVEEPPTLLDMGDTYDAQADGIWLFNRGKYAEALPLLLVAARRGFKDAQSRVGYIYLQGLGGIPRSDVKGIGWLSVAASGNARRAARQYFRALWDSIPAEHLARMEAVVEEYQELYGGEAHGVTCRYRRGGRGYLKEMKCLFQDEFTFRSDHPIGDPPEVPIVGGGSGP